MADYREVLHERLYVRVPGTDKLRKTAANRLKHLLANGWREIGAQPGPDHIMVKFERTGHAPMKARLPKRAPRSASNAVLAATTTVVAAAGAEPPPSVPPTLDLSAR